MAVLASAVDPAFYCTSYRKLLPGRRHLTSACSRHHGAVTRLAYAFGGKARAIAGCG